MLIATWNVNSLRARLERVTAWLARRAPDVVCLQETKCRDEEFPRAVFEDAGWHVEIYGQKTYNGVAILSRTPLTDVVRGFPNDAPDAHRRMITATTAGVRLVNLYVPNGSEVGSEKYVFKLAWLDNLAEWLHATQDPGGLLVALGDFNIAPDDRDVYDPIALKDTILCSEPERARFRRLLEWGCADALRLKTTEPGQYTWWDYRQLGFPKNRGLRIDHLLMTPPAAARLESVVIDRDERKGEGASDHAPVVATLSAP